MPVNDDSLFSPRRVALTCLIALPSFAALATFAAWHLSSTAFWYDESMQFWISLGLDGFGPPLLPPGGLRAAIYNNAVANLDPGGFTVILRYWLRLSTDEMWQRALPFLFFVTAIAGLGWIGWSHSRSLLFAMLCSAAPAMFPHMLDYATEVRAYSMEVAGVVIGCVAAERLAVRPDLRLAFFAGSIFGLFLGSRYSFALFTVAAFLAVTYSWMRRNQGPAAANALYLVAFLAPVGISSGIIFVLSLWPQYEARISYDGGALVRYLVGATAAEKSAGEISASLAVNVLHPWALPLTVGAFIGVVVVMPRFGWPGFERIKLEIERLGLTFLGMICLVSIALSGLLWKWHPWNITTKWSLWLQALSAVALVRLCAAALSAYRKPHTDAASSWNIKLAALTLVALLALDLRLALYRRQNWPTFVPDLTYLEEVSPAPGSVSIDVHSYPTIRYFYEYGAFSASRLFPAAFRMPHWSAPKPLITEQTRFLITGLSVTDANRIFAPAKIIKDPNLPDRLFRVETLRDD